MAAERKFQIMPEKQLGELPKEFRQKWQALVKRRERHAREEKALNAAMKKFFRKVEEKIEIADQEKEGFQGLRLSDDGTIMEVFCECPSCQADLQGMSVSTVVEEMIRQDLIQPPEIDSVRRSASEIDASKRTAAKRRLIYN